MAMDFFEKMMNCSVLGSDFFKAFDEATKNIQANVHTVCEKWKNGELVSKDEEKYENGKKILDVHQSKNIESEGNTVKTDENKGCICTGSCDSDGGCNKSAVSPEDEINRLTLKIEELSNRNKELYDLNKDLQKANDDLLYHNTSLVKEKTSLKAKLDKFKNLLESEF